MFEHMEQGDEAIASLTNGEIFEHSGFDIEFEFAARVVGISAIGFDALCVAAQSPREINELASTASAIEYFRAWNCHIAQHLQPGNGQPPGTKNVIRSRFLDALVVAPVLVRVEFGEFLRRWDGVGPAKTTHQAENRMQRIATPIA